MQNRRIVWPESRYRVAGFVAIVLAGAIGCSRRPDRYGVSGTVTFADKPIPAGSVVFIPDTSKGNSGPAGFAKIKNGRYDTSVDGKGTVGGPHIARVTGLDGVPSGELTEGGVLFPEFTMQLDLPKEAMTQDFKVPASASKPAPRKSLPPP